jgi:hypothetical protein
MPKYHYVLNKEVCLETYKKHARKDLFEDGEYPLNITLIVDAEDEKQSFNMRKAATDISMWILDHIE